MTDREKTPAPEKAPLRKPDWIKVRVGHGRTFQRVEELIRHARLHTVCQEALCPNKGQCWSHGRATFMILGGICTRGCAFCGVHPGCPTPIDADEPRRLAEAVSRMNLREIVITSVTRDDLPDGGAAHWVETLRQLRRQAPNVRVEILVPDFAGHPDMIQMVINEKPSIFGHNLETVSSLQPSLRARANYQRSLAVLRQAANAGLIAKTSIMVGVGESRDEVEATMRAARAAGCRIFFMGQYLRPTPKHTPVQRYVEPAEFDAYRTLGLDIGFDVVVAGPLVRSSYHDEEQSAFLDRVLK
jgi:lipoic acid synthetase